jgi:hypothetical protein
MTEKYINKSWPDKPTAFDLERMEKADQKRKRRGEKRLRETANGNSRPTDKAS